MTSLELFRRHTCPLAEYGYNRDGKKGKLQVVIGIICDDGMPYLGGRVQGQHRRPDNFKAELINLKESSEPKSSSSWEPGMVTNARIAELEKEGWWESFSYITALTREEMMKGGGDKDHPSLDLFDHHQLVEVEKDGTRYVLCHNPERKEKDRQNQSAVVEL